MTVDNVLTWMESSAVGQAVLNNAWFFPTLETLHFVGLILLIGSLYVMDLRLMGFARQISTAAVMKLVPLSLLGFGINVVTGTLFLFADPFRYYPNLAFRLKMLAILLAGLNLLWLRFAAHPDLFRRADAEPTPTVRLIAVISLLLWTSVIVFGRLIPYVE